MKKNICTKRHYLTAFLSLVLFSAPSFAQEITPPPPITNCYFLWDDECYVPAELLVYIGSNGQLDNSLLIPLSNTVQRLKDNKCKFVVSKIIGHTDTVGSKAENIVLSRRYAESIQNWLHGQGVNTNDIEIVAGGEENLFIKTADNTEEVLNRFVEIKFTEKLRDKRK